jgi:diguanylate cyclase (GGDEF)-like protein
MLDNFAHPSLGVRFGSRAASTAHEAGPPAEALVVLVLGRDPALASKVAGLLREAEAGPATITSAPTLEAACRRLAEQPALAVFVDLAEPEAGGLTGLVRLQAAAPATLVVPMLDLPEPGDSVAGDDPRRLDRAALTACLRDAVRRREDARRLYRLATHDPLTGLANRRLLEERLERALARARRTGVGGALLFVDLDGLKGVNDRLGHEAGDRLLVETARRLRDTVRATDTVARYGGDEFVLLLDGADTDASRLEPLVEGLRARLAEPVNLGGHLVTVPGSIGAVLFPAESEDAATLLRRADQRMYAAKAAGRRGAAATAGGEA